MRQEATVYCFLSVLLLKCNNSIHIVIAENIHKIKRQALYKTIYVVPCVLFSSYTKEDLPPNPVPLELQPLTTLLTQEVD